VNCGCAPTARPWNRWASSLLRLYVLMGKDIERMSEAWGVVVECSKLFSLSLRVGEVGGYLSVRWNKIFELL